MSCGRLRATLEHAELSDSQRQQISVLLDEDIAEALQFVGASAAKMDSLLSGVLKLSRVGRASLTIRHLDMNQMLADIIASVQFAIERAGATVELDPLPHCHGDQLQISQVFSNLLDNALKYLEPTRPGTIRISGHEEPQEVVYSVQDNGVGIAEEHQQSIFQIFHRLNPQTGTGEGLGLTIVRRVVDRHNGRIWVESTPNEGSVFYLSLPKLIADGSNHEAPMPKLPR
jgi:signal transduction histidine kinase